MAYILPTGFAMIFFPIEKLALVSAAIFLAVCLKCDGLIFKEYFILGALH